MKDLSQVQVGYFSTVANLDLVTGSAIVDEWELTNLDLGKHTLTADLPHFSGYMVSSGRR